MSVFKIGGLVCIFISFAMFGFFKAYALKKRRIQLFKIIDCLHSIYEQIHYNGGELSTILPKSLISCDFIIYKGNEIEVLSDFLKNDDKEIIKDFFANLGSADTYTECERIKRGIAMLERQYAAASVECDAKVKLWQCAGVSAGMAVCIFLI